MSSELCGFGEGFVNLSDGVSCSGDVEHFVCKDCLEQHVKVQSTDLEIRVLRKHPDEQQLGRVYCPFYPAVCRCSPYSNASLARLVTEETFENYIDWRMRLMEEQKTQELDRNYQLLLEAGLKKRFDDGDDEGERQALAA